MEEPQADFDEIAADVEEAEDATIRTRTLGAFVGC
jgi:hypothetical protein